MGYVCVQKHTYTLLVQYVYLDSRNLSIVEATTGLEY
jgi:hypothetical protein